MIVVAILAILAALAIPNYQRYTLRARSAEAYTMLNVAKNQEFAWYALYDCFTNTETHPVGPPGPTARPFSSMSTVFSTPCDGAIHSLNDVGIVPAQGSLYFSYQCVARIPQTLGNAGAHEFTCSAYGDLDGNGVQSEVTYCTDFDTDGTGYPTAMGTACSFPYEVHRVTAELF